GFEYFLDEYFRCRCAGGYADAGFAFKPARIDFFRAVDQVRHAIAALRELAQTVGVGAVRRANDEYEFVFERELLHRILPVLRGIADVLLAWPANRRKALPQGVDDA